MCVILCVIVASCIHAFISIFEEILFQGTYKLTICEYLMYFFDYGFWKKKDWKIQFKDPKIDELISLIPEIECSADFRKKYGSIIPLMKLRMKEGILSTLVQFYDLMYHCFTFPDYQLMPTLEEYSYLLTYLLQIVFLLLVWRVSQNHTRLLL